jgi:hypothetical protein
MTTYTIPELRILILGSETTDPLTTPERVSTVYEDPEVGLVIPGYEEQDVYEGGLRAGDWAPEIALRPVPEGGLEFRYRDPADALEPLFGREWRGPAHCADFAELVSWAYSL